MIQNLNKIQVGTVVETAQDFYGGRLNRRDRKTSFVDEVLSDKTAVSYAKRKAEEIDTEQRKLKPKMRRRKNFKKR